MGTESLAPGAAIPVHRHLSQDEVLFIHKGQGRATLEGKSMTVLPGLMLYVPRNAWHGLRNTGTGLLQFTWTSAPPGIEEFFREVSRLGASSDAASMQAIAQRHGLEFHPSGEAAAPGPGTGPRRRRHRRTPRGGGRGPTQTRPSPTAAQPAPPSVAPAALPQTSASPAVGQPRKGRRRRHRGRPDRPSQPATAGASVPSPSPARTPAASPRRQGPGASRHYRGRVKEVYMDGRWVQVRGEGPVIAPGHEGPRRSRSAKDEDTPSGPLSVPL